MGTITLQRNQVVQAPSGNTVWIADWRRWNDAGLVTIKKFLLEPTTSG